MKNTYCVYMHKNKINGKVYIGITGNIPEQRWRNGEGYNYNTHFYNAIQKYGWDEGFDHIILFKNMTKEEAEQKEIDLIKYYDSTNENKGYNMQKGGNLNFSKTVYQYDRYAGILIDVWENTVSIEQKTGIPNTNISMVCLGGMKTARDFYFSYKNHGEKLPDDIMEWINTNDSCVRVAQYDLDGNFIRIYDSISDACKSIGVDKINLRNKTSFGYIWKRVDNDSDDYINKLSDEEVDFRNRYIGLNKECYQYSLCGKFLKSFLSATDAAKSVGSTQGVISSACRGDYASAAGFYWKYADDAEFGVDLSSEELESLDRFAGRKVVFQYDLNGNFIRSFKSVTDTAAFIGCSTNEISKVCMRKNKTSHGFIFRYEEDSVTEDDLKGIGKNNRKKQVEQFDMNDNYIATYNSIADAERLTGTKSSSITNCCKGLYKHANHFKWKYVN